MKDLSTPSETLAAFVRNGRVLIAQEDSLARFFPTWTWKTLDPPPSRERDVDPDTLGPQEIVKTISEVSLGLLQLGSALSSLPKAELKAAFDEFLDRFGDYVPRNTLVTALSGCDSITPISEWLEGMGSVDLEGERVYPAPGPLLW
ncbi:hypothetical protein SmJEL517_g06263 [Synchytrium microbalum]|uniref:Uncharacterized protein n=1 Tax=Synchytrium microbalum TaxID=1806994 RepID=A0A507BW53_9FUNG|nr:uncharacterized protein SmJEL517_g06263 [Synchytrium microbalum]TPX30084.1 hypothetical protein SmJEL517_g06263 [Synchytrium microbalum]